MKYRFQGEMRFRRKPYGTALLPRTKYSQNLVIEVMLLTPVLLSNRTTLTWGKGRCPGISKTLNFAAFLLVAANTALNVVNGVSNNANNNNNNNQNNKNNNNNNQGSYSVLSWVKNRDMIFHKGLRGCFVWQYYQLYLNTKKESPRFESISNYVKPTVPIGRGFCRRGTVGGCEKRGGPAG